MLPAVNTSSSLRPRAMILLLTALFLPVMPLPAQEAALEPPPSISQFPADVAFPGEGPIRRYDWFRNLWTERRSTWWKQREQDRGAVVFLGDSITQGWATLSKDFPDLKVANRGISGDVTRGVLFRLQTDVLDLKPRAVVLLIGTNDLEEGAEPETIARNLEAILRACQAHRADLPVIVCRVMPSDATMKRPASKIREINDLVDKVVKRFPAAVGCDTWTPFADALGNAKPEEFPDLLHPNAAGYARFADTLRPLLAGLQRPQP